MSRLISQRGFTLIEIMIALAILGILLALGVPALSSFLSNGRIRAVASEIRDGLHGARSEAIRCNKSVNFISTGTGWTYTDCAGNTRSRTARNNESGLSVTWGENNPATVNTAAPQTVTFSSTGRVTTGSGRFNISAADAELNLRIIINVGGMVRTCNPNNTTTAEAC